MVDSGGGDVEWGSNAPEEAEEGDYVADVGAISHLLPQIPSNRHGAEAVVIAEVGGMGGFPSRLAHHHHEPLM
jgi:hypothetical protein